MTPIYTSCPFYDFNLAQKKACESEKSQAFCC